ncbi:hypothetical protein [Spongorhabdus nitratireducens]
MMNFFEQINSYKYAYLGHISEPEDNCLRLVIEGAGVSDNKIAKLAGIGVKVSSGAIETIGSDSVYEVYFDSYIGYSVRDESLSFPDDYEVYEGKIFGIYSKSHYLDFISKASFASSEHPGPFKHYAFHCLNHIVDVVSADQPIIKRHPPTA